MVKDGDLSEDRGKGEGKRGRGPQDAKQHCIAVEELWRLVEDGESRLRSFGVCRSRIEAVFSRLPSRANLSWLLLCRTCPSSKKSQKIGQTQQELTESAMSPDLEYNSRGGLVRLGANLLCQDRRFGYNDPRDG